MIIDRKNKYKGYLNIDEITYKTKSGKEGKRELMVRQNAVAALLYDTVKEKYILIHHQVGPVKSLLFTSAKFLKRLVKVVVSQVSLKKSIPLKWIVKS